MQNNNNNNRISRSVSQQSIQNIDSNILRTSATRSMSFESLQSPLGNMDFSFIEEVGNILTELQAQENSDSISLYSSTDDVTTLEMRTELPSPIGELPSSVASRINYGRFYNDRINNTKDLQRIKFEVAECMGEDNHPHHVVHAALDVFLADFSYQIEAKGRYFEFELETFMHNLIPEIFELKRNAEALRPIGLYEDMNVLNSKFKARQSGSTQNGCMAYKFLCRIALTHTLVFEHQSCKYAFATFLEDLLEAISTQNVLNVVIPKILVGIEPNPGPQNEMEALVLANKRDCDKYLLPFMFRMGDMAKHITSDVYCNLILSDGPFRTSESKICKVPKNIMVYMAYMFIKPDPEITLFERTDNGFMVGVEKNPGPNFEQIPESFTREFEAQGLFSGMFGTPTVEIGVRNDLGVLLDQLSKSLNGVTNDGVDVTVTAPQLDGIKSTFESLMVKAKENSGLLALLAYIVFNLYVHSRGHSKEMKYYSTLLSSLAMGYMYRNEIVTSDFVVNTVDSLIKLTMSSDEAGAYQEKMDQLPRQTFDEIASDIFYPQAGVVDGCVTAFLTIAYAQVFKKSFDATSMAKFLKSLGDLPKAKDGAAALVAFLLELVQKMLDFFSSVAGVESWKLKTAMFPELEKLDEEFTKFVTDLRDGMSYNYDSAQRLFDLEKRAMNIIASIPNSKEFMDYKRSAIAILAQIKPYVGRMERNNIVNNGPRREPLGVMIGGPTGAGKSTSTVPLLLKVISKVIPEDLKESFTNNHNDQIWNFMPENPFFDSYHGQFAVIVDEAGAKRDVAGDPSPEALAAMRMINTANFPLHMANLEDKGNVNFRSEIVFATTNRTSFDWKSIYCPQAYCRRFKVSLLMVPKREYCTDETASTPDLWSRKMDYRKIPRTEDGFSFDLNEFYPYCYDPTKPGVTGAPLNMHQVIDLIVEAYGKNKEHNDKLLAFHKKVKLDGLREREAKVKAQSIDVEEVYSSHYEYLRDMDEYGYMTDDALRDYIGNLADSIDSSDFNEVFSYSDISKDMGAFVYERIKNVSFKNLGATLVSIPKSVKWAAVGLAAAVVTWKFAGPLLFTQSGNVKKDTKSRNRAGGFRKVGQAWRHVSADMAQVGISQNAYEVCRKIAKNNLYKMYFDGKSGRQCLGFCLFIKGRHAIMPEHFLFTIDELIEQKLLEDNEVAPITFVKMGALDTSFVVSRYNIDYDAIEDLYEDIAYVTFPKVVHCHADITKFVCFGDELVIQSKFNSVLVRSDHESFSVVSGPAIPTGSKEYQGYSCENSFSYPVATKSGECGAPLFFVDNVGNVKLCGMHVAGNNSSGISLKLSRLRMEEVFSRSGEDTVIVEFEPQATSTADLGRKFLVQKDTPKLRNAHKTKIVKSVLHEQWGKSDYAPAMLRDTVVDGKLIKPWEAARSKYSNGSKLVHLGVLDCVVKNTVRETMYASIVPQPWAPKVLTFEEACGGVEGVDYLDAIPRHTSAGYPWQLEAKGSGKTDWFGTNDKYEYTSDKCISMKEHIDSTSEMLKDGHRMDAVYADHLKDERRKQEKVAAGKTRLFSAAPLDSYILFKIYYGDFIRWMMSNRIHNGSAVGVNPYGHEWTTIATYLTSVGDKCIFGDYSGYDGALYATFEYKFLELVEAYYHNASSGERMARKALFEDIVNSRHVAAHPDEPNKSVIYEWFGGNPSGNLLTTLLNTFCNICIIKYSIVDCYAIHKQTRLFELDIYSIQECVSAMPNHVRVIAFGDDNGVCLSDDFAVFVDQQKMTEAMGRIGFTYTDEAKSGAVYKHRDLTSCSFLKRGFVKHRGQFVAPLELAVILEMPYWTKQSAPQEAVPMTIDTAIMELALHGRETFQKYAPVINQRATSIMQHFVNINYEYQYSKARHCEWQY